jgi:hypothetical protein
VVRPPVEVSGHVTANHRGRGQCPGESASQRSGAGAGNTEFMLTPEGAIAMDKIPADEDPDID